MKARDYLQDDACMQARCVLMYVQIFNIEESWSEKRKEYLAIIEVGRWENCREQGYVLSLRSQDYSRQLNIAFFEHRNSDSIHAVKWEQSTINTPNIDTAKFKDVYKDKFDTSYNVNYMGIKKMGNWITHELESFWNATKNNKDA